MALKGLPFRFPQDPLLPTTLPWIIKTLSEKRVEKLHNFSPYGSIWVLPKIIGTPKSSILIGFSIINHPFWGTPIFGNIHIGIPNI